MEKRALRLCDTSFRDAHQSLLATRLRLEDMLPIASALDGVGFAAVEMWGGATFDSAMRFLNENPWDRVRRLKAVMPQTPFQMLLRGQNVVGYKHYPDDVLERFVACAKAAGIDVFRVFDALNDLRNMAAAIRFVKQVGGHAQGALSYTISPVHTIAKYVELARQLADLGADSIAIKDMAGMITPYDAYELVRALKDQVALPVQFHTHSTSGMGTASALKAIEAGVDVVDTAISSLAGMTSQPAAEPIVAALARSPRDTGLDLARLADIADYFARVRRKYAAFESGINRVDVRVLQYQIPGGMLSNLVTQLRQQGAAEHYEGVLKEVPRVRQELGYPPLVTPTSQIVGTQATMNVVMGARYQVVSEEVKSYVRGYYGRPPAPIDPAIQKLIIGAEKPITCRPADLLEPGMEKARQELGALARSEEDVVSYALFPQVARTFLERHTSGIDETFARIAAIAAKVAIELESNAAPPAEPAARAAPSLSGWRRSFMPATRWTGL